MRVTEIIPLYTVLYFLRVNTHENHYYNSNVPSELISSRED